MYCICTSAARLWFTLVAHWPPVPSWPLPQRRRRESAGPACVELSLCFESRGFFRNPFLSFLHRLQGQGRKDGITGGLLDMAHDAAIAEATKWRGAPGVVMVGS